MSGLNPLDFPICFTWPLRFADRYWLEHVPFGMFVVAAATPQVIVELGTHHGVSYCSFCQAVKTLGLDSRCYAIDTWEGDENAGHYGPEVLAELRVHHDPLYGSFSTLLQSRFEDAVTCFQDGRVDLLHLDGCHTYEAVWKDFDSWVPKLSNQGIMLVHDINAHRPGFGVWRFWREVSARYPHFEFRHGYGLGVLAVGHNRPGVLDELLEAREADLTRIREFFYQLGMRLRLAQEMRSLRRKNVVLADRAWQLTQEVQALREQYHNLRRTWLNRALVSWAEEGFLGVAQKGTAKIRRRLVGRSSVETGN